MKDASPLYSSLLGVNQDAFAQQLFAAAYHALCAAMGCALHLRDARRMEEVEKRAQGQFRELNAVFAHQPPANAPLEMTLYGSLQQIACARRNQFQSESSD